MLGDINIFLNIGRHDYRKAELESVCRVRWVIRVPGLGSGNYFSSSAIKRKVKGVWHKTWQQVGEEDADVRDIEKNS